MPAEVGRIQRVSRPLGGWRQPNLLELSCDGADWPPLGTVIGLRDRRLRGLRRPCDGRTHPHRRTPTTRPAVGLGSTKICLMSPGSTFRTSRRSGAKERLRPEGLDLSSPALESIARRPAYALHRPLTGPLSSGAVPVPNCLSSDQRRRWRVLEYPGNELTGNRTRIVI